MATSCTSSSTCDLTEFTPGPSPFTERGVIGGEASGPIALYVHIPFCQTKCPYCDFNTYARIETLIPSYVAALNRETALWGELMGRPAVGTVFFGGGTPSYLPSEQIGSVLTTIRAAFDVAPAAEVTLEANPGDFTESKLSAYLGSGVNRLSIGVQSLSDRLLKALGRRHSVSEALDAYRMAQAAGFGNVSIDLMYGLPYQTIEDWQQTLDGAAALAPTHISMYCLTLEGGTPMERWVESGQMPAPDPDLAADMYLMAQDVMRSLGYRHYEISNWAKPGFESLHNLTYWRNQPYLGVGPGAHSYLPPHRFFNLKPPREYVRLMEGRLTSPPVPLSDFGEGVTSQDFGEEATSQGFGEGATSQLPLLADAIKSVPVVEGVELIDRRLEVAETLMLGLRLDTGISIAEFERRFGATPAQLHGETIAEFSSIGLLETVDGHLRLTQRGRMLANQVFSRFFA